jgi:hypothetical protein
MAVKKEIKINVNTKDAEKNVDNLEGSIDGVAGRIDKMTGGMVSGFRNGVKGIKQGVKAMKSLKVAVAATGIGLLLIAITALTSYFTKTQRGADKLSQAFKGIGAVVDVLVDRISTFGEGLFKILSGDFSEGLDILKGSFSGIVDEMKNEAQAAIDLEKAQQALEDRQIELIKVNAKRRASIEELRLVAEDENKTNEQRADALRKAAKLQNEIADDEIAIAKERARIIRERVALGESSRDDIRDQAEAEAEVIRLEGERNRRLRSLQTRLNAFTEGTGDNTEATELNAEAQKKLNAEIAKRDEILLQEAAKYQETISAQYDKILEEQNTAQVNELNAVEDKYSQLIANAEQYGFDEVELTRLKNEEIAKVNNKYNDAEVKATKDKEDAKLAVQLATASAVAGTLGSLGKLAGEQTQAGKALSAAEAIINTYTGATKALAQGGIVGPIAAAGVIATGLASVRAIYATEVPNTSSGGVNIGGRSVGRSSGAPSVSLPTPTTPRATFDSNGSNLGNQIASSLAKTPVRAYVVSQDVQTAGQMDRKIRETATIG